MGIPVSVVCVTYNHERFISQALDSFLAQRTTFDFRICVADDCSTDSTRKIVSRYVQQHPDRIVLFEHATKNGAERNAIEACSKFDSTYVAICDGDDYWNDPNKLQLQYDYMESHPEIRACFHDTEIKIEDGGDWFLKNDYSHTPDGRLLWCAGHEKFQKKETYSIKDYIPCGFVHSSAMFIRWDRDREIPEWYFNHILGDYTLWVLQVGLGTFGFIDRVMSVYRRHGKGSYNFNSRAEFWFKTKADWVSIDQDVYSFLESCGADQATLSVCRDRQIEDLSKYFKASLRLFGYNGVCKAAIRFAEVVELLFGLPFPDNETRWNMERLLCKIDDNLHFGYRQFLHRCKWFVCRHLGNLE